MRQAQPGPQQRALGAVQAQQAVGWPVIQQAATLREQPAPHPGRTQAAALDGEVGQFLERVHLAQRLVELQAVDDQGPARGWRQVHMLGPQVAVAADDAALGGALGQVSRAAVQQAERGISFEEITVAVEAGALLDVVPHPKPKQYPRQKIMVVEVFGYAYLVPFVEERDHFFLKTIIPSRKATRDFIAQESDDV
jgi:hypothetical protein